MDVARHYVSTGARQIHYRRAGSGPPLILLHGGLGASGTMHGLIEKVAPRFTTIAMDIPGCGGSSALDVDGPGIHDYASAIHEAIQALGIKRTDLYGKHTGAKVALALAIDHPEIVGRLTLDVLSLAAAGDVSARLAAYAPAIEPEWHGAHLLRLWHQVRNAGLFFPWYEQTAAARLSRDLPSPDLIHAQVVDLLCAEADYRLLFAANYDMDARAALPGLRVPTTILVHEGDPTAWESDEIKDLPHGAQVERLPASGSRDDAIATVIARKSVEDGSVREEVPAALPAKRIPGAISRDYVMTSAGKLHMRLAGEKNAPALVVLHAGPGSTHALEPLICALATNRSVLAFDTLGHGRSDPPATDPPDIGLYAGAVLEALVHLGIGRTDVFGTHTGSLIAVEMALRDPKRVGRLVLDGVPLFTPHERDDLLANYIPVIRPQDDGTHLIKLWHMLRDMTIFWPWYRHTKEGIRPFQPPDAKGLHRRMVDTLPAIGTYHLAYAAAFRYPTRERLPELRHPALMCAGPTDPLLPALDECGRLAPAAVTLRTPGGSNDRSVLSETVAIYERFLSGSRD